MEGYLSMPVEPYEIPYRASRPARLNPPTCWSQFAISSSAVAYASFRMKPQYMIAGHAAGVVVSLAIEKKVPVHLVDIPELQRRLQAQKQTLHLE
jgi:hypothetical protein